jgi:prepilin-type N-terminal cleavage/methylation domain-containing protein
MQNIKLDKLGFTLIETVIVITIFTIILFTLAGLYISYYQAYNVQQAIIGVASSASTTANELQNAALQADQIIASHTFSSTVYNTDQDTLVLEMPSIDSSGNIISGKYDYVVFYVTGTDLYKLAETDSYSSRQSGLKKLSDTISTITFVYNNINLSQANEINVDMEMQKTSGHKNVPYNLHQKIYLRNL